MSRVGHQRRSFDLSGSAAGSLLSGWSRPWRGGTRLMGERADSPRIDRRLYAKRVFDVLVAGSLWTLALPLVALIALAIKIDSPGPVFFLQTRIGRHGRTFRIWKFRSMARNAEQVLQRYLDHHPELRAEWEQNHKIKNDPRITRIGRLLRRTSLDELPQLWNVLRGDMGLVGPRPIVHEEVKRYRKTICLYRSVRPGLTGLWQVSGRNDLDYSTRVCLDAWYVRNWSIALDVYILARTGRVVIFGRGAH